MKLFTGNVVTLQTDMEKYTKDNDLEKLRSGIWMNGFTDDIAHALSQCEEQSFILNSLPPSRQEERKQIVKNLLGSIGGEFTLHSPFHCDFGMNIHIGDHFVGNFNLTILDEAEVRIGDNVFIGPNVTLCTINHALETDRRNSGIMCARPVTIGNNVWIATNVVVLPGVTIGDGAVIGAGSVVTKDIPAHTLAVGNPCRVVKELLKE